jgi:hypothetical protein
MLQSLVFFLSGSVWGWLADRFGPLGDHNAGPAYDPDRAALSGHRRLRDDRSIFHIAGRVRRRRHARPIPGLSRRKIPDRGTRDDDRLRLSPGRDLRRLGCTGHHLFCYQLAIVGFAIPMLVGTTLGCVSVAAAILLGPETSVREILVMTVISIRNK